MPRDMGRNLMIAGVVLLLAWFVAVVLRFLVGIAFLVGLALVIIGAVMHAASPRR